MNARLAEGDTLLEGSDCEPPDGHLLQGARNFHGAVAVGVGFDYGQHLGTRSETPDVRHVLRKSAQID
jgi:hypothetical protein